MKDQRQKVGRTYVHNLRKGHHSNTVGFFKIKENCDRYRVIEL